MPSCLWVAHCHVGQLGHLSSSASSVIYLTCHLIPSSWLRCRPALTLILNTRTELNYFPSPNVGETPNGRVKKSKGADATWGCQDVGVGHHLSQKGWSLPHDTIYLSPGLFFTHTLYGCHCFQFLFFFPFGRHHFFLAITKQETLCLH